MATENDNKSGGPDGNYLELYKMLHEERVLLGAETRKLEVTVITAVAALYAWLATHEVHGAPWYIGVALVLIGCFRAIVLGERTLLIKKYLKGIEGYWVTAKDKPPGYETYFEAETKNTWYMHIRYTVGLVWVSLLLATIFAPRFLQQ